MATDNTGSSETLVFKLANPLDILVINPSKVGHPRNKRITGSELRFFADMPDGPNEGMLVRWLGETMSYGSAILTTGPVGMGISPPDDVYNSRLQENMRQQELGNLVHHPV